MNGSEGRFNARILAIYFAVLLTLVLAAAVIWKIKYKITDPAMGVQPVEQQNGH
jgi:hypothetical protein